MSVCLSVCPFVCDLTVEPFDLRSLSFAWGSTLTLAWDKVKGQGQLSGAQRSILGARLCRVQKRAIGVITSLRYLSVCL